jgi:hypothetical protein
MGAESDLVFENLLESSANPETREQVFEMWRRGGVLSPEAMPKRFAEVLLVARDPDGTLVGVCTVVQRPVPRLLDNHFHHFRCFVASGARRQGAARAMLLETRRYLTKEWKRFPHCKGVLLVVENEYLKTMASQAVWPIVGFTFVGVTPSGHHLRVHYFPGARIA